MATEIKRNSIVSAPKEGGHISLIESETGELLARFACPAGRSPGWHYTSFVEPGTQLEPEEGVVIFTPAHRIRVLEPVGRLDSSANPNFRVTNAMREAREFEMRLKRMEVVESRMLAREKAMVRAGLERDEIPRPVEPATEPVAATEPEPAPEPETSDK